MIPPGKAADAYRTIGEIADETGIPQHILRYWESRFPELRPLQRAGRRRHYRPEDLALVRRIDRLLNHEGYTVKGVQQLLAAKVPAPEPARDDRADLQAIRDRLAAALATDGN